MIPPTALRSRVVPGALLLAAFAPSALSGACGADVQVSSTASTGAPFENPCCNGGNYDPGGDTTVSFDGGLPDADSCGFSIEFCDSVCGFGTSCDAVDDGGGIRCYGCVLY